MRWTLVVLSVLIGMASFSVGFRLTDEVTIVLAVLGASAAVLGFSVPRQWWLMAVGLGVGVGLHHVYPPPPYQPDARHLALGGPPQPLPLPFGLTGNSVATIVAVVLMLMSFLCVATGFGSLVRRLLFERDDRF
jgi:hypothetical protein